MIKLYKMKEQLIEFKTAKLAKEKGFALNSEERRKCMFYASNGGLCEKVYDFGGSCLAPTQSLLQKWFREEYKIFIQPIYHKTTKHSIILNDDSENTIGDMFGEYFKTYEEALEKGLQEALKLIEV